jgi:hypothetical protein
MPQRVRCDCYEPSRSWRRQFVLFRKGETKGSLSASSRVQEAASDSLAFSNRPHHTHRCAVQAD